MTIRELREDDIQIEDGFIIIPNALDFEEAKKVKQQLLLDQEDAKEMRKIYGAGFFCVEDIDEVANRDVGLRAMLKRLDDRIEEINNLDIEVKKDKLWSWSAVVDILQNIREDKK